MKQMKRLAVIGLGKMGAPMAKHLIQHGYEVSVYNRDFDKTKPLVELGAVAANTPREAVQNADIVISVLFDDAVTLELVIGKDGVLAGMKSGAIHMCAATILPKTANQLEQLHREQGFIYVGAPVIGAAPTAVAGKLLAVLAGDPAALKACEPICQCYSTQVMCVGDEPSQANMMKICFHYTLAASIEIMSEVYAFADKSGFDLNLVNDIFTKVYAHPAFHMYADKIKNRDFKVPGLDLKAGLKDVNVFRQAYKDVGANADIADIIQSKLVAGMNQGLSGYDWSVGYETTRLRSGLDSQIEPENDKASSV